MGLHCDPVVRELPPAWAATAAPQRQERTVRRPGGAHPSASAVKSSIPLAGRRALHLPDFGFFIDFSGPPLASSPSPAIAPLPVAATPHPCTDTLQEESGQRQRQGGACVSPAPLRAATWTEVAVRAPPVSRTVADIASPSSSPMPTFSAVFGATYVYRRQQRQAKGGRGKQ
ncbi:hypothetical protein STCU_12197 [Strigomonas culicis]|uniref:Uncharacterized protein n=1 Tax=Strigomonas culicis TaxID=28005 RepID=S9TB75_9TRYP|nr:hypothetical protein STCU_12197 [Strigomonas culicis]|eukprot:EPY15252.1 hypothetical protein STCU_12197 [Strigomonas culicis]